MGLYKHKKAKKLIAVIAIFLIAVFFCVSPNTVFPAYANPSDNISTKAILPKDNFGILKKINGSYYLVDKFGNIVDVVFPTSGVNLNKYIGKTILIKDNVFAGIAEFIPKNNNGFLPRLRTYLSGLIYKLNIKFKKDPPTPILTPPIAQPLYGVEIKPVPLPIEPPIAVPLYGVEIEPIPEPVEPPPYAHPVYGVEIKPVPSPIEQPIIVQPMYGVEQPIKVEDPIEPPGYAVPMYGIEPGPVLLESPWILEKNTLIQNLKTEHNELDGMGIKIVADLGNDEHPLKDIPR